MKVIVPSLGRAGTSASMRWLEGCGRKVTLAIHRDEIPVYSKAYPWAHILELPNSVRRHAGKLRKYILAGETKPFFFVDDDIVPRFVHCRDAKQMFDILEGHMDTGVPMVAIGKQIFSNGVIPHCTRIGEDPLAIRNKFASTVYGIRPKLFANLALEKLVVYEDCALVIHAIQHGGTIISFSATHNNKSPPGGGCNSWRTKEIVLQSLDALCKMYPDICKKIETKHTAHGHALGVGVRVAWSRISPLGDVR